MICVGVPRRGEALYHFYISDYQLDEESTVEDGRTRKGMVNSNSRAGSDVARLSRSPSPSQAEPACSRKLCRDSKKLGISPSPREKQVLRLEIPGNKRSRNSGPLLCTFSLGILALAPFLGSLGASSRATVSPSVRSIKSDSAGSITRPSGRSTFLTPEEVAGELLSDRRPRCFEDEEGLRRCLPTVFFLGVSKCGTTSLSNWLASHPRVRFSPAAEGKDFRETHLFDFSPKLWHATKPHVKRSKLASLAEPRDTVVDFTPHYSLVAETPLRIADFYGEGLVRTNGLRFLVLLREPVARTISSWEYKSDPDGIALAQAAKLETNRNQKRRLLGNFANANDITTKSNSTLSKENKQRLQGIELRTLKEIIFEGKERATRLADCISNASEQGLFGREPAVTFCRRTKGPKQCEGQPPCQICNSHTEPWCNPRTYLEANLYNAHVGKSVYALHLKRWFDVFGKDKFKVVFTEDMAENPLETLDDVLKFLSLDMVDPGGDKGTGVAKYLRSFNSDHIDAQLTFEVFNESLTLWKGLRRKQEWVDIVGARYNTADRDKKERLDLQVTPELVRSMQDFFAPHNKALEDLLGVPLPSSWHYKTTE